MPGCQQIFRPLANKGINIQVISTSEIKGQCADCGRIYRTRTAALHTAYGSSRRMTEASAPPNLSAGEGGLASGWASNASAWAPSSSAWARGRDVLGCDLRHHGRRHAWVSERNLVARHLQIGGGFGVIASGSMSPALFRRDSGDKGADPTALPAST